ncbi:MAG: leucine-rich repeat domain-containing protein, partial [Holosporales bacterium]|nr:leucine-rich repeat domain-containing protein [Holosporales bacterium]
RTVGDRAFAGTTALGHISLPNIENLGPLVFGGSGVLEILIGGVRPSPTSGVYAGTGIPQDLWIDHTVTELPIFCFAHCSSLVTVTFEADSQLASILDNAFAYSAIQSICLPASLRELGCGCFYYCQSLSSPLRRVLDL